MSAICEFRNPDNLAVDTVFVEVTNDGVVKKVRALDRYWVDQDRQLMMYVRPPSSNDAVLGELSAWKQQMQVYLDDLKWMLRMRHHRFWSTIIYHPLAMDCLVSFLQEAYPPYVRRHECEEVRTLYSEIRRYVMVVFSRLITNKENPAEWMTKQFMADLIYDNFIFTVPILWDLCLVYAHDNLVHMKRLIGAVFALQPKYDKDCETAIDFVKKTFLYITMQVNKDYQLVNPPSLPETFRGFTNIHRGGTSKPTDKLTFDILKDLVVHLLDTALTLRLFFQTYPGAVGISKRTGFVTSMVQFYEYALPFVYEKLEELGSTNVASVEVERQVSIARIELIDTFREIVAFHKNAIIAAEGEMDALVEEYFAVMIEALVEKMFIQDYHSSYPINEDLEVLRQACPEFDIVKMDFLLQAIYSNMEEPVPEHLLQAITNGDSPEQDSGQSQPGTSNQSEPTPLPTNQSDGIPNSVSQEALIKEVKDVLPHLGDGFILKCLQYYGFNAERVVNSILSDHLAESLQDQDQGMPIIPEDKLDTHFLESGVSRLNVFDGDEFDPLVRKDIDLSRIHRGKQRSKYKNINEMLNDKSDVKQLTDIYSKYNIVYDEVEANLYSDEYDDSYDYEPALPPAADGAEPRRPQVTPIALRAKPERTQESSDEESSEEEQSAAARNRLDFCSNPEEIRTRREAAYQAKRGKGHRLPPTLKSQDVVGKAKGQGQEKEVLHNREKKEKQKSSRGNHSRRQGAAWKRSQGMMPS